LAKGDRVLAQDETQLLGRHNAENLLATLAATDALGIERSPVVEAMKAYRPQPHRCERVAEIDGVLYLNDSKGTNVDAIEKALTAVERPVVLIAGGKDKGLSFLGLRDIAQKRVKSAILIGETREQIAREWEGAVTCEFSETLELAVRRASLLATPGDAVLLSPGCSSFDMFRNYAHRGDIFRQEVLAMNHPTKNQKEK
jgi:UDP-N-acetylmuramoylalanine--D-glutamate ligase